MEPRAAGLRVVLLDCGEELDARSITARAFSLVGLRGGDLSRQILSATLVGGHLVRLAFDGALPDGDVYTLSLVGTLRTATGARIVAGGAATVATLVGDVDGSGRVDAADVLAVRAGVGRTLDSPAARCDVDGSGAVTGADMLRVRARMGRAVAGR